MKLKRGDIVLYKIKNEVGIVKRPNTMGDGVFVWYHMGGTAASSPYDILEKIPVNKLFDRVYSNEYALGSLLERRERLLQGEHLIYENKGIDDLIENTDVRPFIKNYIKRNRG